MHKFTRCLALAIVASLPTNSNSHDAIGLANEFIKREELAARNDPDLSTVILNAEEEARIRVLQMLGSDLDEAAKAIDQFSVKEEGSVEQVFLANKRWAHNKILTACFFDGTASQHRNVMRAFDVVLTHTNLGLAVTKERCPVRGVDIQIKINTEGCSSYYGRAAKTMIQLEPQEPTMSLCNSAGRSSSDVATMLHEIMHSVGFVHEQQHGDQRCWEQLDLPKLAMKYLPNSTPEKRQEFITTNFSPIERSVPDADVRQLPYDKGTPMHYLLGRNEDIWKAGVDRTCAVSTQNATLTEGDKRMLRAMYPSGIAARVAAVQAQSILDTETIAAELASELAAAAPDLPQQISNCFNRDDCSGALAQWIEASQPPLASEIRINPRSLGLTTADEVILVSAPKPGPGTGGGICSTSGICATEDEQAAPRIDYAASGRRTRESAALSSAPQTPRLNGTASETAEISNPAQAPGTSGCGSSPFCSNIQDTIFSAIRTLDYGVSE